MSSRQCELKEWQNKNFPRSRYEKLTKDELIDLVIILQQTIGMAEEVGEICHHILKGTQGIRGGVYGLNVPEIVDGVNDTKIFGNQLLSSLDIDANDAYDQTVDQVLKRNWKDKPENG